MEPGKEITTYSILIFGFFLGLRHATDADHLAAVSAIVSEKKNLLTSAAVGGLWGVGHTIALFAVGVLVILLKLRISETTETRLEAIVGGMLIILGANALRKLFQSSEVHLHTHTHEGRTHTHIHTHRDETAEKSHHRFSPRSVIVGLVHGLAGSAALMLLIVPTVPSPAVALLYIVIFGVGSIGGMVVMSFVIGLPFHFTANRFDFLNKGIRLAAGLFSLGLGGQILYVKLIAA